MAKQPSSKNRTASKDKGSTRPASASASRRNPSSSSHSSSTQRVDLAPQRSQTSTPVRQIANRSSGPSESPRSPNASFNSSSSSSTPSPDANSLRSLPRASLVPSPPANESRLRCLAPLNLSSAMNQGNSSSSDDLMAKVEAFFERQEKFNDRLEQRVIEHLEAEKERENSTPQESKRLPKALTANVREVYGSLIGADGEGLQWDFSKSFSDPHNKTVNAAIKEGIRSTDSTTPTNIINAAMRVHFRTKKRQKRNVDSRRQQQVLQEQRRRSRKNTKRVKRAKVLRESTTMKQEDKEKYKVCMSVDYMSSEESVSEPEDGNDGNTSGSDGEGTQKKHLCVRPLPWRSREVNLLMSCLDRKVARRRSQRGASMLIEREQGPPSTREAPDDAPDFALA